MALLIQEDELVIEAELKPIECVMLEDDMRYDYVELKEES